MEHSELISGAISDVKKSLFGFNNLSTWIKLFLQIIIPMIAGWVASSLFLQFGLKPLLVKILVNDNLGFTEAGITHILQFVAAGFAILCIFIVPLFQGFLYRLIRTDSIPRAGSGMSQFFSGWRVNVVFLFYAIPMILIYALYGTLYYVIVGKITALSGLFAAGETLLDLVVFIIYLALMFITFIIVSLFAVISLVHVARGASFKKAFNIKNSARIIKQIGWYNYILCMVICAILILILSVIFLGIGLGIAGAVIPVYAIIIGIFMFLLIPVLTFCCRYVTKVYDVGTLPPEEDTEDFDNF